MTVGYLIVGMIAGICSAMFHSLSGGSLSVSLLAYVAVGSGGALLAAVLGLFIPRDKR